MTIKKSSRLVVGSRNRKKLQEIAQLLEPHGIQVVGIADFADIPEVVEDGDTFAANAAKKASETATAINEWVLAEDSGLSVDALGGAPGVYSARFSGEDATDERNNQKLLQELAGVAPEKRGGYYTCHVAISSPAGEIRMTEEGTCRGRIIDEARGDNGFGYDPYFLIPEFHQTFGELSSTVKNQLSHRARAFQRLTPRLVRLLLSEAQI
ncbi:MAG: XTP/dITP diphosphatase [Planctomycetota bacterium]|nr:XTP/dITP diphosphatase [Planctomycetota bacterium]MDA0919322.1 XTP/dITP diphosphatase [Planctomycetota bacterium]